MNDEQSGPEQLTTGSGSRDLGGLTDSAQPEPGGEPQAQPTAAATDGAQPRTGRNWSVWRELPILIVVALAIALVIKSFVVQPFYIPSSSMEDTLLVGDKVLVNKLVYHFRSVDRGDIIVFSGTGSWNPAPPPATPASNPVVRAYDATLRPLFRSIGELFGTPIGQTDYVKRVIGIPGDHVACCNAQGLVTVNGVPLHESSYLYPGAAPSEIHFSVIVPAGRLWVMGDNRLVSDDSRLRQSDPGLGTIPENEVVGRAFMIVWPPSRWRILPIPSTFSQPALSQHAAASVAPLVSRVAPAAAYAPLAAGVVGAVPLTWLQRRARRGLARRLRARRANRQG